MYSRIKDQLGPSAILISLIALLLAASGVTWAASNSSDGPTASASAKKAKRGPKGPRGPKGATGAAGPAGPVGPAGQAGPQGAVGPKGDAGAKGADGKSAFVTEIPLGDEDECDKRGGIRAGMVGDPGFEICNGEKGPEGSPWVAGGTLPVKSTLTGVWAFGASDAATDSKILVPISFSLPLVEELGEGLGFVHYSTEANFKDFDEGGAGTIGCKGFTSLPTAPSGHLCVYARPSITNAVFEMITDPQAASAAAAGASGALIHFKVTGAGAIGSGSWAVTG